MVQTIYKENLVNSYLKTMFQILIAIVSQAILARMDEAMAAPAADAQGAAAKKSMIDLINAAMDKFQIPMMMKLMIFNPAMVAQMADMIEIAAAANVAKVLELSKK